MIDALYRSLGSLRAWVTVIIGAVAATATWRSPDRANAAAPLGAASSSLSSRKHTLPLLALLAAAALGLWLLLPGGALHAQSGTIEFPENGEGTVAVFTATDPEGKSVEWSMVTTDPSVTGIAAEDFADSALFDIDEDSGELTFKSSPDFEAPAGGSSDNSNDYKLVIAASTGTGDVVGYQKVEVEVTNEEETATTGIELSSLQPQVSTAITVVYVDGVGNPFVGPDGLVNGNTDSNAGAVDTGGIVDPDRDVGNTGTTIPFGDVEWQWSRSSSRNGAYTDITGATSDTYEPGSTDQGMYLRVTATYADGEGEGKTVMATSRYAVRAFPSGNSPPAFPADFDTTTPATNDAPTADVADGATEGDNVGDPITAPDANNDRLTYSLESDSSSATDADVFQINRITGQVTVGLGKTVNPNSDASVESDTETRSGDDFVVTIKATDPSGSSAMVTLTITAQEVDEAPMFTAGKTSHEYAENTDVSTTPVYTFAASDPENTGVNYALSGADSGKFTITGGVLSFNASPNFERPGDANGDNVYEVTVKASDTPAVSGTPAKSTSVDVTVEVTNEDEAGTVTLSASEPRIGVELRAISLTDVDGTVSGVTWQWSKSTDNGTTYADIEGATMAGYTPVAADDGHLLRVTASYTDPQGSSKEAMEGPTTAVQKVRNLAPVFTDEDTSTPALEINPRAVAENSAANTAVTDPKATDPTAAAPVVATDTADAATDDDTSITYLLGGADASSFSIAPATGQISVGANAALDHETKDTYVVTVTARDLEGLSSSVDVTINVTDVDEAPEIMRGGLAISGPLSPRHAEGVPGAEWTYTLVGPNAASGTLTLGGDDAGDFTLSNAGVLTFAATPDYERPADADMNNVYEVTLSADDGTYMAQRAVTITVTNVDEDGTLTLSSATPAVDAPLTATYTDPDGETNIAWQWALEQSDGSYRDIPGATSDSYTPVAADEGFHLRVTVTYDDGHGAGKSLPPMITANPVVAGDPLVVRYDVNPNNGKIDRAEAIQAIRDHLRTLGQDPPRADVIKIIRLHIRTLQQT